MHTRRLGKGVRVKRTGFLDPASAFPNMMVQRGTGVAWLDRGGRPEWQGGDRFCQRSRQFCWRAEAAIVMISFTCKRMNWDAVPAPGRGYAHDLPLCLTAVLLTRKITTVCQLRLTLNGRR